jgi:hypothetical protein
MERRIELPGTTTVIRRHESGYVAEGPGFYTWDEDPEEVIRVARQIGKGNFRMAPTPIDFDDRGEARLTRSESEEAGVVAWGWVLAAALVAALFGGGRRSDEPQTFSSEALDDPRGSGADAAAHA